jgi:CubicO group peptidase (beta-lactamase class C family)
MTAHPLPAGTPAAEGVDADGVHAFLDGLEAAPDIEPHSLMLLRHGRVVAAGWWAPYTEHRLHLLYSLSKSFTSTAAALAVAEGLMSLDDPVISYFPEFEAEITDPRSRALLVRHAASMAGGHLGEMWDASLARDRAEPVRGFLLLPPDREPGTVFAYSQPTTYALGAIVQRVTGQTLTEYLRPRLFEPLGIGETAWQQYPRGRDLGFSGMFAATDAIARLGQLYLSDGVWEGRRLLPGGWVAEATRAHVSNADGTPQGAASDWQQGYGLQFWRSRHGYRGDGAYGQFCVVLPEYDVVLAMTAATEQMQAVLDLAWTRLLPAFGPTPAVGATAAPGAAEADAALRERLARLALPPLAARPSPPAGADAWAGARFAPAGGRCADQPSLTGVTVASAEGGEGGDGKAGWALTLAEGDSRLELRFAGPDWAIEAGPGAVVPTALSAGWTDPDTLVARVVFLETPHRLVVTCSLAEGTFTARWSTMPLQRGPLRSYGAPREM